MSACFSNSVRVLGLAAIAWAGASSACTDVILPPDDCRGRFCEPPPVSNPPETGCYCDGIYAPVCGADGVTYGNRCAADCADVYVVHEGECTEDAGCADPGCLDDSQCKGGEICDPALRVCIPDPNSCACDDVYDPVCGADGETYGNHCEARCAAVRVAYEGECKGCTSDEDCPNGACEHFYTCAAIGCPPPPPSECSVCGDGSVLTCLRAWPDCPEGQVPEVVRGCFGGCVDRHSCLPAEDACDYESGERSWVLKDPEACKLVDFNCIEGMRPFFNDCGCGCEPVPTCRVAGCSGQLCVGPDDPGVSTCEWLDEYACYNQAICEVQQDGECGWTQTEELRQCIVDATTQPPVD